MDQPKFTVVVPATTANLGPGYDCFGLALDLTMEVRVYESDRWHVEYREEEYASLTGGESNLIVKTILGTAKFAGRSISPHVLVVSSNIPLGKGLGSSASAIAAGVEIANEILQLDLSMQQKLELGTTFEGHADNVNAAIHGGFVLSYYKNGELDYVALDAPKVGALILVPDVQLATSESRSVIPDVLNHAEATAGSAAGHLFVAAIANEQWSLAGKMLERDTFHEPFRKKMFPHFDEVRALVKSSGAYGMTISGAGPSLFVLMSEDRVAEVAQAVREQYPVYEPIEAHPSNKGTYVQ